MRTLLASFLIALLLPMAALARPYPLVDPEPIAVKQGLSQAKVLSAIKQALLGRGWIPSNEKPGSLDATYTKSGRKGDIKATIAISYDKQNIQIKYKDSEGLDYAESGGERTIHGNYTKWIGNLQKDIPIFMERIALQ